MRHVEVKLCGLRSLDDLVAARDAGADMLGIVLAGGRRAVPAGDVARIVERLWERAGGGPVLDVIGVVAGTPPADVPKLARAAGVRHLQLSGDETWARAAAAACDGSGLRLTRAVPVREGWVKDAAAAATWWEDAGVRVTFDAWHLAEAGGTGREVSVEAARLLMRGDRGLAGGLTPDNVTGRVRELGPALVDVSSGIEDARGCNSAQLMRSFVTNARAARHLQGAARP